MYYVHQRLRSPFRHQSRVQKLPAFDLLCTCTLITPGPNLGIMYVYKPAKAESPSTLLAVGQATLPTAELIARLVANF